jgi:hypothetical protein
MKESPRTRTKPEQFSCEERSPSPDPSLGERGGEGEGIRLSFTAFFSAGGSGLNSTKNSEEPPGISLVDDAKASSSFVEQPASAAGAVRGEGWGEGEPTSYCIDTAKSCPNFVIAIGCLGGLLCSGANSCTLK